MFLFSVFSISAGIISYEIYLMRVFSYILWHHFGYMAISVGLLGFGVSGAFISIFKEGLLRKFPLSFFLSNLLFGLTTLSSLILIQKIPFSPFLLVWYGKQYLYLLFIYLLLLIPFFCGALSIGLALTRFKERTNKVYGANLLGSGFGALLIIFISFILPLERGIFLISSLGFFAALLPFCSCSICEANLWMRRRRKTFLALTLFFLLTFLFAGLSPFIQISLLPSEYKGISRTLNLPSSRITLRKFSPLGIVEVVESPFIREAAGLSLNFQEDLPAQALLFLDGEEVGPISRFDGDTSKISFVNYLTSALPYHLLSEPTLLIIGAGGGTEVLNGIYHKAKEITALELNPQIVSILKDDYRDFSGSLYQREDVKPIIAEARGYLEKAEKEYDLISLSLLGSFTAASSGLYSLNETYLYTLEAFQKYIQRLKPGGILSITSWLKEPPRDNLKILYILSETLARSGLKGEESIIFIRGLRTATILAKKGEFTQKEIEETKEFCKERLFETLFYPGIKEEDNLLKEETYFQASQKIISKDRENFLKFYPFNISPPIDDSPYFFHFFKWKSLPLLLRTAGKEWIPFLEWGYIVLIATLSQALVSSIFLILLPLFLCRKRFRITRKKGGSFLYFSLLGFSFMLLEMAFIQKFVLFLSHPLYATGFILTCILIFSGLGSCYAKKLKGGIITSVFSIILISIFYLLSLKPILSHFLNFPLIFKIFLSLFLLAPLSFFMGIPFPLGLERAGRIDENLIPWCWGINGCFSVIATIGAVILMMAYGFQITIILAIFLYLSSAFASLKLG